MPFVDKTHPEFKWEKRDGGDSMSYMWQVVSENAAVMMMMVVVVVVVVVVMMIMMKLQ